MIADNSIKNKTTHMRRASIYTENDEHPTIREDGEHLVPSLQKGKKVPLPKKVTGFTPQLTRFSGQFNDFNKEWREKREKPGRNKYVLPSHYGSQAAGYYHHDKEKKVHVKFHKIKAPPKEKQLNPVTLEKQEQRTTEGSEIAGKQKLSHAQAMAEIRKKMKKINRGINQKKGYYGSGMRYNAYVRQTVREDSKYKELNAKNDDEFTTIEQGLHTMENYGQQPTAMGSRFA